MKKKKLLIGSLVLNVLLLFAVAWLSPLYFAVPLEKSSTESLCLTRDQFDTVDPWDSRDFHVEYSSGGTIMFSPKPILTSPYETSIPIHFLGGSEACDPLIDLFKPLYSTGQRFPMAGHVAK